MVGRRGFLQSISAAVLGLSLAIRTTERDESYLPPIEDRETGISIRFVRHWDEQVGHVNRFDILAGYSAPMYQGTMVGE